MPDALDTRERFLDWDEATRQGDEGRQSQMWTALPAIASKHDGETNTVHVKSAVKLQRVKADGSTEWVEIPELKDVPVHYYGGGGATFTVPVKEGDEGLVVFASRSMDKWWDQGGVQEQTDARMHSLSDGFFIPGFRSQKKKLSNVSTTTMQLRSEDGEHYFEFDPEGKKFKFKSSNPVTVDTDLHVTGEVIAKHGKENIHVSTHTHNSVEPGQGHTNKPDTGT